MKAPRFWHSRHWLSTALLPLAALYDMGRVLARRSVSPVSFPVPVICVGNVTVGGAGKTPVALYLGQRLKERNAAAFFLTRGYGGRLAGPVRVNPDRHTPGEVGDEPLLLARVLPTVVARDRVSGANYAITKGARAIIMDDGFQNRGVTASLSLLVVDGAYGFGNGRLLPAGPLREPPEEACRRAHALVVLNRSTATPPLPGDRPVFYARTYLHDAAALRGKKILPFCGIAAPRKFFDLLAATGARIVDTAAFPDHYAYRDADLRKLLLLSFSDDAALVTTAKDAVRLPEKYKECVAVIEMGVEFDNPAVLDSVLDYVLNPDAKS